MGDIVLRVSLIQFKKLARPPLSIENWIGHAPHYLLATCAYPSEKPQKIGVSRLNIGRCLFGADKLKKIYTNSPYSYPELCDSKNSFIEIRRPAFYKIPTDSLHRSLTEVEWYSKNFMSQNQNLDPKYLDTSKADQIISRCVAENLKFAKI